MSDQVDGGDRLMPGESAARSAASALLAVQLARRIHGVMHTQLIFVAATLGIADLLAGGARSVAALADATGTAESRLYRVLRALASLGIFVESPARHFALTPLAEPLRADAAHSVRDLAILMGSEWHLRGWARILESVYAERPAFEAATGTSLFEYLRGHAADDAVFQRAMTRASRTQSDAIAEAYDFTGAASVVDIGGGHGFLLSCLLRAHPELRAVLLETPAAAEAARRRMAAEGYADRCTVVAGDFFTAVPAGADVYVLKHIIHDWDDQDAARILVNCRGAMGPTSRILVVDAVMPMQGPSFEIASADIQMMVLLNNGRERTEAEFAALFSRAGLRVARIVPTRSPLSIVEGVVGGA
jgi:hypothetical protein